VYHITFNACKHILETGYFYIPPKFECKIKNCIERRNLRLMRKKIYKMDANFKCTEALLIEGCLKGDRKSQKALYDTYAPKLFTLCLRYTKHYRDAEDVLQDGFVKLFNNLDKFKGDGSFEGWVRRIFVNTAIQQFRNKKLQMVNAECYENVLLDNRPSGLDNLL